MTSLSQQSLLRFLTLAGLTLASLHAAAQTTHIVDVGDNFFSESELTIEVGDTVRWVNPSGGNPHDVESDDGVFSSGAIASAFTFEFTFTEPGVYPYYCSVHGGPGGVGMSGTVTVEANGEPPLTINPGLNDAWFNPQTGGQGLLFTVFPDAELFFAAWFTFDTERPPEDVTAMLGDPGHRWVTAIGGWEENVVTLNVELTTGGVFGEMADEQNTEGGYGTIVLEFHDCNSATMSYEIPSQSLVGETELQRINPSNVALCQALQEDDGGAE